MRFINCELEIVIYKDGFGFSEVRPICNNCN